MPPRPEPAFRPHLVVVLHQGLGAALNATLLGGLVQTGAARSGGGGGGGGLGCTGVSLRFSTPPLMCWLHGRCCGILRGQAGGELRLHGKRRGEGKRGCRAVVAPASNSTCSCKHRTATITHGRAETCRARVGQSSPDAPRPPGASSAPCICSRQRVRRRSHAVHAVKGGVAHSQVPKEGARVPDKLAGARGEKGSAGSALGMMEWHGGEWPVDAPRAWHGRPAPLERSTERRVKRNAYWEALQECRADGARRTPMRGNLLLGTVRRSRRRYAAYSS